MKRIGLLLVVFALLSFGVLAGQVITNDTGEDATGLRVVFSTPVLITGYGDTLTSIDPTGLSYEFVFSGGTVSPWDSHWFNFAPNTASVVEYEWLVSAYEGDSGGSPAIAANPDYLRYIYSRTGSPLEDLKRFAKCDGSGPDTILELWREYPILVDIPQIKYAHFGSTIDYSEVLWSVIDRFERRVEEAAGYPIDLFEPGSVRTRGIIVDSNLPLTWAQFEEYDWSRSGAPRLARLHIRFYTTADTTYLEIELEHALLWLLLGCDGHFSWPLPTRRFRTQSTDLSNQDLVRDSLSVAEYEMLVLALKLGDGTDLSMICEAQNRPPAIIMDPVPSQVRPQTEINVGLGDSYDLDGDAFSIEVRQLQGYTDAEFSIVDSGVFSVVLPQSGDYVFEISATDSAGATSYETVALHATAPCPSPNPIATRDDMIVAAHYVTIWGHKYDWRNGNNGDRSTDLTLGQLDYHSYLGAYDMSNPDIADWHIKMAVENGVNCFIVPCSAPSFSWDAPARNLEDGLLSSQYIDKISFFINLNTEPWLGGALDHVIDLDGLVDQTVAYICDNYVEHPSYLWLEGKPVLMLFHSQNQMSNYGPDHMRAYVDRVRQAARSRGYELFIIGDAMSHRMDDAFNLDLVRLVEGLGAYVSLGMDWTFRNGIPYSDTGWEVYADGLVDEMEYFSALSDRTDTHFMPSIPTGIDTSPAFEIGYDNWFWRRTPPTDNQFRDLLDNALEFLYPVYPMLIIYAWNEQHEGEVLEPTHERGYSYLEAIRDAVGILPAAGWPENVIP